MKIPDANGIVIDGFPRDIGQALSFEDQVCFQKCVALLHAYCLHVFKHTNKQVAHYAEHVIYVFYYLLNYYQARTLNRTLINKVGFCH